MTIARFFAEQLPQYQYLDFCLRLIAGIACGAVIGLERSHRFKEAGIRTHVIVCCASVLIMLVSKYGFADFTSPAMETLYGTRGADPARIAAQVVTGISFLCAGVIFKQGITVRGLTTAAGIWFTAGVGLALGAGMYFIGIFSTVLITLVQFLMHRFQFGADSYAANNLRLVVSDDTDFNPALHSQLDDWGAVISESKITRNADGSTTYELLIRRREEITFDEFDAFCDAHDVITSASNIPVR